MFEDSLIESAGVLRTKRRGATAVSLTMQSAFVAILASLPLFYTQALPQHWMAPLVALGPPPGNATPPVPDKRRPARAGESDMIGERLREPQSIPKHVAVITESEPPMPSLPSGGPGVYGGTGIPGINNILKAILTPPASVVARPVSTRPLRVSQGVAQGFLLQAVKPLYPPLARQARIQGAVVLEAIIGKDGRIENLRAVSGHPMLAPAALQAVRQWRYRPYTLNGEPVEVETQITVNFVLGGS